MTKCIYCGFDAPRLSDEDCPNKPKRHMSKVTLEQYAGQYVLRLEDLTRGVAVVADFTRANDVAFADLVEWMNEDRKRLDAALLALWFEHYKDAYPEARIDHGDCAACTLLAVLAAGENPLSEWTEHNRRESEA